MSKEFCARRVNQKREVQLEIEGPKAIALFYLISKTDLNSYISRIVRYLGRIPQFLYCQQIGRVDSKEEKNLKN